MPLGDAQVGDLAWAGAVGLVSPYLQLYDEFTARENLTLALTMRGSRSDPARITDLLEQVALAAAYPDPPSNQLRCVSSTTYSKLYQKPRFSVAVAFRIGGTQLNSFWLGHQLFR